jgi:hypothetical protein
MPLIVNADKIEQVLLPDGKWYAVELGTLRIETDYGFQSSFGTAPGGMGFQFQVHGGGSWITGPLSAIIAVQTGQDG